MSRKKLVRRHAALATGVLLFALTVACGANVVGREAVKAAERTANRAQLVMSQSEIDALVDENRIYEDRLDVAMLTEDALREYIAELESSCGMAGK